MIYDSRRAISSFLFKQDEAEPVDLAFVFCSPTISSLTPAVGLYASGMAPKVLITGAGITADGLVEWSFYRDHALASGVAQSDLLLEKTARNTAENAAYGAALVESELGWNSVRKIAVCCKPFHMRRAIMTLRRYIPEDVRIIAQPPSDPRDLSAETWWQTEHGRNRVLAELGKIAEYALKGDLGDI
ncbi:YdcF family protein [Paracoccus cavernae]|uniref:YdcF family protein n=1 Tax=Paracoccus cavernae TaxID=1571207 RepID=UPI0035F45BB8